MNAPITSTPWFNARRFGFGWRPVTWQGWAASGAFVALVIGVTRLTDDPAATATSVALLVCLLVLVCYLTGGRSGPVGPGDRNEKPSGD